ncbi:MAG: type IV pili twitching motility protein PilT, partial [Gammaproteobacteria bacterium]|nr:type IV pili twitching motility protein PilT [Gammaproteobacteria bacterium]NIR95102.1 type IV pili twitching motility protein PilT [Gammaproteobacteria bacterium]NIW45192.1 type IV pili twitching motility protein PilT [Gammaproteobacteria bacterium]
MPRINAFLQLGRDQGGSDVHLAVGIPPMVRLHGELIPIKYRELTNEELQELVYEILTDDQKASFENGHDLDFSYEDPDVGRFRVNLF